MRVSFRAHLISGIITVVSFVFTCIALFSCRWVDITILSYLGITISDSCPINGTTNFAIATLVFMFIAFIAQCLFICYLLLSFFIRRYNRHVLKIDTSLIGTASGALFIAVLIYGIGASIYYDDKNIDFSFGYSFILACIAMIISLIAGGPVGHAYKRINDCGDCECEGYYIY